MSADVINGVQKFPPITGSLYPEKHLRGSLYEPAYAPHITSLSPEGAKISDDIDRFLEGRHQFLPYRMSDPDMRLPQFDAAFNKVYQKMPGEDVAKIFGTPTPQLNDSLYRGADCLFPIYTGILDLTVDMKNEMDLAHTLLLPEASASTAVADEIMPEAAPIESIELPTQIIEAVTEEIEPTQFLGHCSTANQVTFIDTPAIAIPFHTSSAHDRIVTTYDPLAYLKDNKVSATGATEIPYYFFSAHDPAEQASLKREAGTIRLKLAVVAPDVARLLEGESGNYDSHEKRDAVVRSAEKQTSLDGDLTEAYDAEGIDALPLFGGEGSKLKSGINVQTLSA